MFLTEQNAEYRDEITKLNKTYDEKIKDLKKDNELDNDYLVAYRAVEDWYETELNDLQKKFARTEAKDEQ